MRQMDWSRTRLGPVESWPRSLRTMLGVVLGSRFPMLLWWGPDLLHLYNDAYRPILRDKHPQSLAAPAAEVWAEVWDVAGPMAKSVQEGGPATWTEDLQLFIKSGDIAEETYFTFSYSPVPGDDGRVAGLLNTVQETTAKVQSERQVRMLHDLAVRAGEAKSEDEAYRLAAGVLASNELDLPFALLYAHDAKADAARLVAVAGWEGYEGKDASSWPLAEVARSAREMVVDDLEARIGPLPVGRWNARPDRALVLPLGRPGQQAPNAYLVAGVSPHRELDARYRQFFRATADQVASVVANAHAYEAERQRAEALAEVDRAKTAFFSNISHEFRTPLTLILGPVEDALAQKAKSLEGGGLASVQRNALRLLRLVNSMLDFAGIEAGRLKLSFLPTDLAALTADVASSVRSVIERGGLKLNVDCSALPEPVYVDPFQWEKIVLNLLSNAFKFTLEGGIEVKLRSHGDHVELSVGDSGIGIPQSELPRIFDRFHRVEGAKGRNFEGTGIGLSLVRELVALHGGSLQATSTLGHGSSFEVRLPFGRAHLPAERVGDRMAAPLATGASPYLLEASQWIGSDEAALDVSSAPRPGLPDAQAHGLAQARVLVADDNSDMRDYLARLLSARWRVELAEDGQDALERVRRAPPDLVLSDVMMPRLDGFALLRELRADPRTSQIPVLLLSARAGEEAVLEGLETGADDYLVKPFSARELLARVRTHLELARRRREWSSELEAAMSELEAFSYSVSHDLRAPLRHVAGFARILEEDYSQRLDDQGLGHLRRIQSGALQMGSLIESLLNLSRIGRRPLERKPTDLGSLAREVKAELEAQLPGRSIAWSIEPLPVVDCDRGLVRQVFVNLFANAVKYSGPRARSEIEVGARPQDHATVVYVRDNGVGFDMKYAHKLFGVFERLHGAGEFEGTGVGLATVQRIVRKHGGRVWAEAAVDRGATFYFTLEPAPSS